MKVRRLTRLRGATWIESRLSVLLVPQRIGLPDKLLESWVLPVKTYIAPQIFLQLPIVELSKPVVGFPVFSEKCEVGGDVERVLRGCLQRFLETPAPVPLRAALLKSILQVIPIGLRLGFVFTGHQVPLSEIRDGLSNLSILLLQVGSEEIGYRLQRLHVDRCPVVLECTLKVMRLRAGLA